MSEQSKYLSKQCLSALKINTQTKYTYTYRKDSNPYLRASVCYLQNQMKSSGSNQSFCTHHSPLDGAVTSRHFSSWTRTLARWQPRARLLPTLCISRQQQQQQQWLSSKRPSSYPLLGVWRRLWLPYPFEPSKKPLNNPSFLFCDIYVNILRERVTRN